MHIAIPTFLILAACLTLWLGYMVRYRRKLELLGVYSPKATQNKKGLARWAGTNLMTMACLQLLCGLAGVFTGQLLWAAMAFVAISIVVTIIMALGTAEYSKKSI